jgi:hypothetical protein
VKTLSQSEVVLAARHLLERTDTATAGLWPRATALLARQAIESTLADLWRVRAPGVENCSTRAQLLCLSYYLRDERLAEQTSYAWAGLSHACHQHPYELPPTSTELIGWLKSVDELIAVVSEIKRAVTKES